jgi:N-formylmaleamate deformylase
MSRRVFLQSCLALGLLGALPASLSAEPFRPSRISVTVTGSGPDVVLIPGLSSGRGVWNSTVAAVPGYRYHLVQVAGFAGDPARGNAQGKVAASVAEEIARYIAGRRLDRPALVGHSMGGTIAMMVAARHPALPGRVMVVDMVPAATQLFGLPGAAPRPLAGFIRSELAGAAALRRDLKSLAGHFGSTDWLDSRNDAGVVSRSVEELMVTDLTPELPRIKAPLTVLYACPEPLAVTKPAIDRLYLRAYARQHGARLIRISRSGHHIMADQPAVFQRVLRAFLAGR